MDEAHRPGDEPSTSAEGPPASPPSTPAESAPVEAPLQAVESAAPADAEATPALADDVPAPRPEVALAEAPADASRHGEGQAVLRTVRLITGVIVGMALVVAASALLPKATAKPNLLDGKPWRASSRFPGVCDPGKMDCGGARTSIFFHTNADASPWVEFDLGKPETFGSATVVNRHDCCAERAVPLLLEVSDDRSGWREVARRDETFSTWQVSFAPTTARYVRLRVDRQTFLHLTSVALFP